MDNDYYQAHFSVSLTLNVFGIDYFEPELGHTVP
jgi:hypothetical protein